MKKFILGICILSLLSCSKTSTSPRIMIIESLTIKKFPPTKANGAGWDILPSSGPDIYLIIADSKSTLFKQPNYFLDCTATTTFSAITFPTPLRITDYKAALKFQLWDYDATTDEFMGGLEGTPYADNNPTTSTISSPDGQYVFELKLSYEY